MIAKILVQVEVRGSIHPDQYAICVRKLLEENFPSENWFVTREEMPEIPKDPVRSYRNCKGYKE